MNVQEKFHPIASIFPMMSDSEFQAHKEDIRANGLIEPIWIYQDQIIDGRNRYNACRELGIEPQFRKYEGNGSLIAFVVGLNLKRRHLNDSQKAFVALEILPYLEKEAKQRQQAAGGDHRSAAAKQKPLRAKLPQAIRGRARDKAAELTQAGARYISDAKIIQNKAPELAEEIKAGKLTIPKAIQEIRRQEVKADLESINTQAVKAISGIYDVIVVDPPWPMKKIEREVMPNQVEFDYPTMTIEEISMLKIPAADDCHLFLWTTQKFLPNAFEVIKAWGFTYVFEMVWLKSGGFQPFRLPQYNHEPCLYARKGTPEFIDTKNFKTCFEAVRTGHSKKPNEFYDVMRRVTAGRRLDMFNRRQIEGFDGWGNESSSNTDQINTTNVDRE